MNPYPKSPDCAGLQTAGTNFASIEILSPVKTDSDGDHLLDGIEDINHNGWLDFNETDPTILDTDGDGISDGVEQMLDVDGDGVPDVDVELLSNGKKCSPPQNPNDVDCDGVVNARDDDSDDDGCKDADEKAPDVWKQNVVNCGASVSTGASGSVATAATTPEAAPSFKPVLAPKIFSEGGGACALVHITHNNTSTSIHIIIIMFSLVGLVYIRLRLCPYYVRSGQIRSPI